MNCPRCKDDLRRADRTGVEIDFCPRCRGVWLDGGELEKLIERAQGYDVVPQQGYAPPPQEYRSSDPGYRSEPHREGYRDEHRREGYRDDHRRDDRHYDSGHGHGHHKKKKGFLGEIFDIFD